MWLRDNIPGSIHNARVQIYGYESALPNSLSSAGLQDFTCKFLHTISNRKRRKSYRGIPLILIGHSLGCLIIKQALILSAQQDRCEDFHRRVYSVVFFGAPHEGMDTEALQTCVEGQPTQRLIHDLTPGSTLLESLRQGFKPLLKTIKVVSCCELKATPTTRVINGKWERNGPDRLMVKKESACLNAHNEEIISINENHSMIAKFSSAPHSDYWRLLTILQSHAKLAPLVIRRNMQASKGVELLKLSETQMQSAIGTRLAGSAGGLQLLTSLRNIITTLHSFQKFLQDGQLVQAVWPKGLTPPALLFFDGITELSTVNVDPPSQAIGKLTTSLHSNTNA